MDLNAESWSYIEFIYPGSVLGLLSKTQDEVWNFFVKLAWDTYEFEQARNCLLYTSPSPRDGLLSRMPSSA